VPKLGLRLVATLAFIVSVTFLAMLEVANGL